MQNLISKVKGWFKIPRNRYRFILGAIGVFVLVGVVAFSSQIGNLLSLFGSKAFQPTDINWQSGPEITDGGGNSQSIVVSADDGNWLYSVGGLDVDGNRKNSVYRMKLMKLDEEDENDWDFSPSEWKYAPQMNFQRAGHRLVEHNGYIYAIAGDIHKPETPDSDSDPIVVVNTYPLAYSTIERLNINNSDAAWEIVARLTGVHFFPEVLLDGDLLYIIGGIYGNVTDMGGFEDVADESVVFGDKPVVGEVMEDGTNGVPLTVSGWDPDGFERILSDRVIGGKFVTTVSERYEIDLTNPNSYTVDELGLDGGDSLKEWSLRSNRTSGEELKMGHLRFKLFSSQVGFEPPPADVKPMPQGRYGHKIFKEGISIYVAGGAVWANPMEFSPLGDEEVHTIYPFWSISDKVFPKNYIYNGEGGLITYWNNDFIGNTTYRWNGSIWADWVGTGPNNGLDSKYSLEVEVAEGIDILPVISGLSFIGLGNLDSLDDVSNPTKVVVGGIRNAKNELSVVRDMLSDSIHYYMELDEVSNTFTFTPYGGWSPADNGGYGFKHFGIDVIGLGSKAIGFGGQYMPNSPYEHTGRDINGWPVGLIDQTTTQVFDGTDWLSAGSYADRIASAAVAYNDGGNRAAIYRVGGELSVSWPQVLSTKLEYTDSLTIFNVPDMNTSKFRFIPIDEDGVTRIGGDNHDIAAAVFQLNDFEDNPMPDISIGISTINDGLIEKCIPQYTEDWGWYCPDDSWLSGDSNLLDKTDENGIGTIFVRSKEIIDESQYPNGLPVNDISGFWIVGGDTLDNPTGEYLFGNLQLSRDLVPFEPNSQVHFLDQNGNPETSRTKQILADDADFAEVEILLKDGKPTLPPNSARFYNEHIRLTSEHSIMMIQTLPSSGPTSDGRVRFRVKSGDSGEAKVYAWYKPVSFGEIGTAWWGEYAPWVPLFDDYLTIQFTGEAGMLTPDSAIQGDQDVHITATGNVTRWTQGTTTVEFINPPEITFSRAGGSLDELEKDTQYDFDIGVSNYTNKTIELSVIEGGSLTQTSVTTDENGNATFQYRTGTTGGIEKIRATIANGQISQEMWLTVKYTQLEGLYTLEYQQPDPMTADNPYAVLRTRVIDSEGQPIISPAPTFSFLNNDGGTLYPNSYNSETGIAQVLYQASSNSRNAEIFIEAAYSTINMIERVSITNEQTSSDASIQYTGLSVLDDETLELDVDVSDSAEIGLWIFRVTTHIDGQDEIYDYAFEVQPKFVAGEGIISTIDPSSSRRGASSLTINIAGVDTQFDAVTSPVVKFISTIGDNTGIAIVSATPESATDLRVVLDINSNAAVGYWNVEVQIGTAVTYIMPGDFDFLIMPDDVSGYFMNLIVGTYGVGWESGSLPANGTATLELIATVEKFDVWENTRFSLTNATIDSSIASGTGELTPVSETTTGGQAIFTYHADTIQGTVGTLFETTVIDELIEGGEVALEVAATLAKLATQVTFNIVVPLEAEASRYNYRDSEEIRVVVLKDGSSTSAIDDKFKIDADDVIIGINSIYVSPSVKYHIWVDPPNHLAVGATFIAPTTSQVISPILTSDDGTNLSYIGDITDERDNFINIFDFHKFVEQMFKNLVTPVADFNQDGYVNIFDWPFMFDNYWSSGYPRPF